MSFIDPPAGFHPTRGDFFERRFVQAFWSRVFLDIHHGSGHLGFVPVIERKRSGAGVRRRSVLSALEPT
jgi:hypothetical protein